jgi:hypothetical protein
MRFSGRLADQGLARSTTSLQCLVSPTAAVTLVRVTTGAIKSTADQMWS